MPKRLSKRHEEDPVEAAYRVTQHVIALTEGADNGRPEPRKVVPIGPGNRRKDPAAVAL
jgi:hypothetical protein